MCVSLIVPSISISSDRQQPKLGKLADLFILIFSRQVVTVMANLNWKTRQQKRAENYFSLVVHVCTTYATKMAAVGIPKDVRLVADCNDSHGSFTKFATCVDPIGWQYPSELS